MAAPDHAPVSAPRRFVALAAVGTVTYAALATATEPLTWGATLAVIVPGAAVTAIAIHRPTATGDLPPGVRSAMRLWAVVLLAGLLWEAWAFVHQPSWTVGSDDHPTLSVLVGPYFTDPVDRFVVWCLWLAAGWRLMRR